MDARIEEMEIALSRLKEQRALLKRPIDAHRALISPMRRTPDDVLREIFHFCLPSEHNALIDRDEAPMLLGRICRHWQSVAHSTPNIWSSLHIAPFDYRQAPPNILVRFGRVIEKRLKRSGSNVPATVPYPFRSWTTSTPLIYRIRRPRTTPFTPKYCR
jgi:hypothetical protein